MKNMIKLFVIYFQRNDSEGCLLLNYDVSAIDMKSAIRQFEKQKSNGDSLIDIEETTFKI